MMGVNVDCCFLLLNFLYSFATHTTHFTTSLSLLASTFDTPLTHLLDPGPETPHARSLNTHSPSSPFNTVLLIALSRTLTRSNPHSDARQCTLCSTNSIGVLDCL